MPLSEQDFNQVLERVAASAPKGLSEEQFNHLLDAEVAKVGHPNDPSKLPGVNGNKPANPDDFTDHSVKTFVGNAVNDVVDMGKALRHPLDSLSAAHAAQQADQQAHVGELAHPQPDAFSKPGDRLAAQIKQIPGIVYQHPLNNPVLPALGGMAGMTKGIVPEGVAARIPQSVQGAVAATKNVAGAVKKAAVKVATHPVVDGALGAYEGYQKGGVPGAVVGAAIGSKAVKIFKAVDRMAGGAEAAATAQPEAPPPAEPVAPTPGPTTPPQPAPFVVSQPTPQPAAAAEAVAEAPKPTPKPWNPPRTMDRQAEMLAETRGTLDDVVGGKSPEDAAVALKTEAARNGAPLPEKVPGIVAPKPEPAGVASSKSKAARGRGKMTETDEEVFHREAQSGKSIEDTRRQTEMERATRHLGKRKQFAKPEEFAKDLAGYREKYGAEFGKEFESEPAVEAPAASTPGGSFADQLKASLVEREMAASARPTAQTYKGYDVVNDPDGGKVVYKTGDANKQVVTRAKDALGAVAAIDKLAKAM